MNPNLSHLYATTPIWLDAFMIVTSFLTVGMLCSAVRRISVSKATHVAIASVIWMTALALLAYGHFFQQLDAVPPRFILVIGLPLLVMAMVILSRKGRTWIKQLPLSILTLLHTVRVPVELILYALYVHHQIPQLMTFEGRNFDILAGLTAPLIAYFTFQRKQVSARWLLVWNLISLGLVLNIVIHAILSAPLPFQQMAFDQPNVGILRVPYVWLPGVIVPIVLFSHAVAILQLTSAISRPSSSYEGRQTQLS